MGHLNGIFVVLHITVALLGEMFFQITDADKITWFEPPPFETVTDASSISRTSKQVIQGSLNAELSCNFSLTVDLNIRKVSMKFRGIPVVTFVPNVPLGVEPHFAKCFNASWVPNKLTLILFNVTDAVEGEYCCEVVTTGRSARSWTRKIQLFVVDRNQTTVSPITTASEDRSQIMVSSIKVSETPSQAMTPSITVPQSPIPTTDYSTTASEVDDQWTAIGLGVGGAVFIITITIALVYFIRRKRSQRREVPRDNQQGNEGADIGQDGTALEPLAADGIKTDIEGKEEDTSV